MNHSTLTIHNQAYQHNLVLFKQSLPKTTEICAVVKADAYGHGLHALAPAAIQAGANYLGITENHEAQTIRDMGLHCPLLRLRPALPDEAADAIPLQIEEIIGSYQSASLLSQAALKFNAIIKVHIKLDVGISRMGFHLPEQYDALKKSISLPRLQIKGVMTHFPNADEDDAATKQQEHRFFSMLDALPLSKDGWLIHTSNSAAAMRVPQNACQLVRVGIASYGLQPSSTFILPDGLQPVMTWKTHVVQLRDVPADSTVGYGMTFTAKRDSRIATLPVGYANGYLRALSNNADVLIHGRRCPVVGRVSMNMITVDVTDLPDVRIGEEAVLIGIQGNETITMDELAARAGTISYELACLIGACNAASRVYE